MHFHKVMRVAAGSLAFGALLHASTSAGGAINITVFDAKIAAGKLVIKGATAPNTWVRLDGQTDARFNLKSGVDGAFAFGIVYHPGDCIVDLQGFTSPAALGAATSALVADCGPAGVSPRGPWNAAADYMANDLVTYQGSTWRARRGGSHAAPAAGALWELFAAGALAASEAVDDPNAAPTVAPTGAAGGDLTGTYPDPTIKAGAVTTGKIAGGAVTAARLAAAAVVTSKIADHAVTGAKIAVNSITANKIVDGAITSADIADNAITGADILDGSIGHADIANSAVDGASIVDESITSSDLATDSVGATEIADNSIDSGEIVDNSLFANDLAAGSVGSSEIADGAVGTADIANNAVTGAKVLNNSLTTADTAGTDVSGAISLGAGAVANGRCKTYNISVPGASVGDGVIISTKAATQTGIVIYGQRVPSADTVAMIVCNLSGTTMAGFSSLPIRTITFR